MGPSSNGTAAPDHGQVLANRRGLPRLDIPAPGTSLAEVERARVELAMRPSTGDQTQAAKLLDSCRDALRHKLKEFDLMRGQDEASASPSSLPPAFFASAGFRSRSSSRSVLFAFPS